MIKVKCRKCGDEYSTQGIKNHELKCDGTPKHSVDAGKDLDVKTSVPPSLEHMDERLDEVLSRHKDQLDTIDEKLDEVLSNQDEVKNRLDNVSTPDEPTTEKERPEEIEEPDETSGMSSGFWTVIVLIVVIIIALIWLFPKGILKLGDRLYNNQS